MSDRRILAVNVSDIDFAHEVLASPLPVLLLLWARWCAYCRILYPIIDDIASKYEGKLKVARLEVNDNPAVCSRYSVQGIPTVITFKNGAVTDRMVGVLSKEEIERQLKTLLS